MISYLKSAFINLAYGLKYNPIPVYAPMGGWKDIPVEECGEPLVALGAFSDYGQIFTDNIYWSERSSSPYNQGELEGSLITCFVRQGIAEKLAEASKNLPPKHSFLVWDTYRTLGTQQALYEDFKGQLMDKKGFSEEEATEAAQRFVSIPSTDPSRPSPHNTGASVDLTIVKFTDEGWNLLQALQSDLASGDSNLVYKAEMERLRILREESIELAMGTRFDEVAEATATRHYEEIAQGHALTGAEKEILNNRRLLVDALKDVGMSNYPEEWWHFDFGNQFHASRTGDKVIYGAAEFSQRNHEWEIMRQNHFNGSQYWRESGNFPVADKFGVADDTTLFVKKTAQQTGDMAITRHQKARRLDVA